MLQPKERLGDFEIIRLLGKGGMGEVYEAQQSNPERRVALKVLKPWLAEDAEARERFQREIDVPAQLDHPGVVRIFSTGKTDDHFYYAMQLVRGISLSELVKRAGGPAPETVAQPLADTSHSDAKPLSCSDEPETESMPSPGVEPGVLQEYRRDRFATLARIGLQAAKALDSAHRQNYLHRDIKPSNIMIDHHDQVYLVDFGLTKALNSGSGTRAGVVVGTPWYMSPEQARGQPLDARSDIYSLGVTLYQLATGGLGPYAARRDDTDAILRQVRSGTLQPLSSLAPKIAPELERIISRAIDSDPERRYQTAGELGHDLEAFLRTGAGPRSGARRRLARPAAWVVAAALFVGLAITALVIFNRGPEKEPEKAPVVVQPPPKPADPFERSRPLTTPIHLLREDNQPVAHRILSGKGSIQPLTELVLKSEGVKPFFVALDDPKKGNYDLSLKLRPAFQAAPDFNDVGAFFGWREDLPDPQAIMRFFALKLDKRPVLNDILGRLYIGTWQLSEPRGAIAAAWEQDLQSLPKTASWIPLQRLDAKVDGWHRLQVAVRDQKVTVTVDDEPAHVFDVDRVRRNDKKLAAQDLDSAGMVGVWVRNGVGHFRDIIMIPR